MRSKMAGLAFVVICAAMALLASSAAAAAPQIVSTGVSSVGTTTATLKAEVNPQGKASRYHFEYGPADCASNPCTSVPVPEGEIPTGTSPVPVEFSLEGLTPGTLYHFRVVAKNNEGSIKGPDRVFVTHGTPPAGLPDGRAYEQSSPVEKDGGDTQGRVATTKAAIDGSAVTFSSAFGMPGGVGAQALPPFLGQRQGGSSWSTQGLLPAATFGERARVLGWLPDLSMTFSEVTKLGDPRTEALIAQSTVGNRKPTLVSPYVPEASYSYAGASSDGSVVLFESKAKLPPKEGEPPIAEAIEGSPNLYAWDQASGELHLASVLNTEAETEAALSGGGFAGPYDWALGSKGLQLRLGGGARSYFLQDDHAVASDGGSVYFTSSRSTQLYERLNPTQPQSPLNGQGECANPAFACTIHVSASKKTNGQGQDGADSAGPQPAAFQAASADGSEVFFTSPEKLTNDANTGPEQPPAAIGRNTIDGNPANIEAEFIPKRAVGMAADATHIYWADPVAGTIGRAKLDGEAASIEPDFITPPPTECEPGVFAEASPRYVAVDAEHIYWTNTGCLDGEGEPKEGGGTIGRAKLDGEEASIEAAFIPGKVETGPEEFTPQISNPQGIAVSASHIYWANAGTPDEPVSRAIARATISGGAVEPRFFYAAPDRPIGVAVSASHVYFGVEEEGNANSLIERVPLGGGAQDGIIGIGTSGIRGLAVNGTHVYWSQEAEGVIGRASLELEEVATSFIDVDGAPAGIAADATHLLWSVNGEVPSNPGNDLYRYRPASDELVDLTVNAAPAGADVQGVVGASKDGSYLYFVANGDLDGGGPATPGTCHSNVPHGGMGFIKGQCNLYLWHEGTTSLVVRLNADNAYEGDALNWVPTPTGIFGTGAYFPRSARVSDDGQTLLFRSQEKLTPYENGGKAQFYLYRAGEPQAIRCVSCNPSGETAKESPVLGRITFPGLAPSTAISAVLSRNLSADGQRFFFETPEALSPLDTNGQGGCPPRGPSEIAFPLLLACEDVYEWEAPGKGSCTESSPSYSPINAGCIYLISTGKDEYPSQFADASASGNDVFFFTRQSLVGQDKDELQDVYDARVGGGIASQNPPSPPPPCEGAGAGHGPAQAPPAEETPATPGFVGPGNQVPKHKKQKAKKQKSKKQKHKKHHKKANTTGRAGR